MILPDSSVWIAHLRRPEPALQSLLDANFAAGHPYVTLEVALGSIASRDRVLRKLRELSQLDAAPLELVARIIEEHPLWSRGVGFADAALLASVAEAPGVRLWTRDRRLRALARELCVDAGLD